MIVDDLIALARRYGDQLAKDWPVVERAVAVSNGSPDEVLSVAVRFGAALKILVDGIDTLTVPEPCGWPVPRAERKNEIWWEALGARGASMTVDEARGLANALHRAADEAAR